MNFQLLTTVIDELAVMLPGARVERVYQAGDGSLCLALRRERQNLVLLLSPDRGMPRMHLVTDKPESSASPLPFILHLRSRLVGMRVKSVSLLNQDRVVELRFAAPFVEYCLVFELMGSSANLFFVDADSKIAAVYHAIPVSEREERNLLIGSRYVLPRKKAFFPTAKVVPELDADRTANASAEALYGALIAARRFAVLKSGINTILRKALKKNERKHAALVADLRSPEQAEELKQAGDLILANLQRLKTGMERVELSGYDGKTMSVLLDPKRNPSKNAELYFKKYKKAKAGQQILSMRLHDAAEESSLLKSLSESVERTEDPHDLENVHAELLAQGYLKERTTGRAPARPDKRSMGFRKVVFRGWEVLIGSSAAGNDYLTTKLARPDDLWLHAEGLPGSHVLVRNANKGEIPHDVLVKAASLAAFYSKGRNADKAAVTYTLARHVRKPKGAKPGLVTLSERKTVMVRPSDDLS